MAVLTGACADLARRSHGVVTRNQMLAAGATRHQIQRAVDSGELQRVHSGVFVAAAAPPSWHQRVLVAVHAAGPGALASHRAAAHLWNLDACPPLAPEIVAPRHLRSWAPHLGRAHESKDLHLAEPTLRAGIPCTGICRTLLDLGAVASPERVQTALDDALRRRLCSWDDAVHTLARHSRQGRRGAGPLRLVLEASHGQPVPDSRFNRLVQRLIADSGLAAPVPEHEIRDSTGSFLARVDLAYPHLKIAIELDSRAHHLGVAAFEADRPRQNRLELEGWIVLRYTWRAYLDRPHDLVEEVRGAIQTRSTHDSRSSGVV